MHITVDVKAGPRLDPALAGRWDVEGGSTNIMGRQGWTATLQGGDPITFVGHPMRDGSKGVSLFYMIRPDGKRLYHDIARPKGERAARCNRGANSARLRSAALRVARPLTYPLLAGDARYTV